MRFSYYWFHQYLGETDRQAFETLLAKFLTNANFVGEDIEITDEIKVAVGGWAVLLILNRPLGLSWYSNIERVSIHSGSSVSADALGLMAGGYNYCQVHLAWDDIRDSATKATDESNTILHEFAHVLDHYDRSVDGAPSLLLSADEQKKWKSTFHPEYILGRSQDEVAHLWEFFGLGAWSKGNPNDYSSIKMGELDLARISWSSFKVINKLNTGEPNHAFETI